ncbi:MAG TPA: hypothetical protein VN798_19650 [Pseudomonas sp.]|nr:hypothetical protein [Pseudomonas sp.]
MLKKPFGEVDAVTSVLLFSLLPLIPWLVVWGAGAGTLHTVDGPAAFVVLTMSAVAALIAQFVYCGATFLRVRFPTDSLQLYMSVALLCLVLVFCIGVSVFWFKVAIDDGAVFFIATAAYTVFSLRIMIELKSVVRSIKFR